MEELTAGEQGWLRELGRTSFSCLSKPCKGMPSPTEGHRTTPAGTTCLKGRPCLNPHVAWLHLPDSCCKGTEPSMRQAPQACCLLQHHKRATSSPQPPNPSIKMVQAVGSQSQLRGRGTWGDFREPHKLDCGGVNGWKVLPLLTLKWGRARGGQDGGGSVTCLATLFHLVPCLQWPRGGVTPTGITQPHHWKVPTHQSCSQVYIGGAQLLARL